MITKNLIDVMKNRHNIKFFDQKKIPDKELIKQILKDSHNFIPHKNNLIQIDINVWGPEYEEEKKALVLNTVCGPGKKHWRPGGKYHNNFKILRDYYEEWRSYWLDMRKDRVKSYRNKLGIEFNEQVRAPYLLTFTQRIKSPTQNQIDNNFYGYDFNYNDSSNKGERWYLSAGIHGYGIALLSVNAGLSAGFCKCFFNTPFNYSKILEPIIPNQTEKIPFMLGLGYKNENVNYWGPLPKAKEEEYIFWK